MPTIIFLLVIVTAFCLGYFSGNSKRGRMVKHTKELPNRLFRVINIDKISAVLEEINVDKKRFLVSTEVFGEKPIRPKDIVRKIKDEEEREELGISVLGYPPLVKEMA